METNDLLIRQFVFDLDIEREDQFNSINDALVGFVKERSEAIFEKIVTEFSKWRTNQISLSLKFNSHHPEVIINFTFLKT